MSVIVSMILSVAPAYADYQERIEKIQTQIQKHENRILVLEDKKDGSNDANMDERIQRLQDKIADKQAIIDRLSDAIDNTPVPDTGHESVPDTGHESVPDTGHESVPDTGHESVPDTGHESVPEPVIEDSSDLERIQTMNTNL